MKIDTDEVEEQEEQPMDQDYSATDGTSKPFTPIDKSALSKLDQKFQNSIDVNVEDMFGNSIDKSVEDEAEHEN